MKYTQTYLDLMKKAGYDADNSGDVFKLYYSECSDDPKIKARAEDDHIRADVVAAATAHLKTNQYIGLENEAACDIRNMWKLTEEEYALANEVISDAPGTYHQEDSSVPYWEIPDATDDTENDDLNENIENTEVASDSEKRQSEDADDPAQEEHEEKNDAGDKPRSLKGLKRAVIVTGAVFLLSSMIFSISMFLYRKEPEYRSYRARVSSVIDDYDRYSRSRYDYNGDRNSGEQPDHMVVIEISGGYETLNGVSSEDIGELMPLVYTRETIVVYRYNGSYYYTRKSVADSRMCARVKDRSLIFMCVSGVSSFFLLILCIILKKKEQDRI